jgi:superfamily II DNA or RNA helicase
MLLDGQSLVESTLVVFENELRNIIDSRTRFGMPELTLAGLPRRFHNAADRRSSGATVYQMVDARQVRALSSLSNAAIDKLENAESWLAATRRASIALLAWFLLAEDKQQRLESLEIAPLMHQQTLVEHILSNDHLSRVLIGDEVGLGKTVEAGLIAKRLVSASSGTRVLYLAPAQLVGNVIAELRRLGLDARRWGSGENTDARIDSDSIVVSSVQKAVRNGNAQELRRVGPWDLIIVDECHHLSDYEQGGGAPNAGYRMVRDLVRDQRPDGRVLLMSGTPHQGNQARFENILQLLKRGNEDLENVAGRVIYRTKESVTDWNGRLLFPGRDVRPPRTASLSAEWARWYERVSELYGSANISGQQARAGGWARGQALQWVASSVEAGLAFLVRLAIRRLDMDATDTNLAIALETIRPYRGGPENEPLSTLVERIRRDTVVKQRGRSSDTDDDELSDDDTWRPDAKLLGELLRTGAGLALHGADEEKWRVMRQILEEAGHEKVVLFCQPVETVSVVARRIESHFGRRPSIIVGGQSEAEREHEVDEFRRPDGPQFLISSRAGSEGINLQVARRLVHLDIPWNPMDMEQRVGRVHRFGSKHTIIVDTIVVPGSREADAYRIARDKLRIIAEQLDPEKFEQLFGRVMNLVPPEELAEVLGTSPAMKSSELEHRVARIVREGYNKLQDFSKAYSEGARQIKLVDPGAATWADFRLFLEKHEDASPAPPGTMRVFELGADGVTFSDRQVQTITAFGQQYVADETEGLPCYDSEDRQLKRIGVSDPRVTQSLLDAVSVPASERVGAIRLRSADARSILDPMAKDFSVIFFATQRLAFVRDAVEELNLELSAFLVEPGQEPKRIPTDRIGDLVRLFVSADRQTRPEKNARKLFVESTENYMAKQLREEVSSEGVPGLVGCIWPVCWYVVSMT